MTNTNKTTMQIPNPEFATPFPCTEETVVVTGQVVPNLHTTRVETSELCAKGHKMYYTDYRDALVFATEHRPATTLSCRTCWFKFKKPEQKVFICETCTAGAPLSAQDCRTNRPGSCEYERADGFVQSGPVVYCESCVETKGTNLHRHMGQWSSGLFECTKDCRSFIDSILCFPCVFGALSSFTRLREEGQIIGDESRCRESVGMCATLYLWDTVGYAFCMASACYTCALQRQVARLNGIQSLGSGAGFCQAFWCRPCVLARIHRHYSARAEDVGRPSGCLYNCKGEVAVKKPHVMYSRLPPAPSPMMMHQEKRTASLNEESCLLVSGTQPYGYPSRN